MDYIKLHQVCLKAINQYGHNAQFHQLQEECGELIVAINHYIRQREGAKDKIIEELADVYICLRQSLLMLQCWDEFYGTVDSKVNRLADRLTVMSHINPDPPIDTISYNFL